MGLLTLRNVPAPLPNADVQIRSGMNMYQSRFVREDPAGWVISEPLTRKKSAQLRLGENVTLWAPTANGLRRYDTRVLENEPASERILIAKPKRAKRAERRQSKRVTTFENPAAKIEGVDAMLLDISQFGARIFSSASVRKGERVKIDMANGGRFGWVLESRGGSKGSILRVCFEEPLPL